MKKLLLSALFIVSMLSISYAQLNGGVNGALNEYQYKYISSASTTTVKSGAGILESLLVTGGTAGTIVVYDNTSASGPTVANFDSTNAIANYPLNIVFSSGCTVVTGSATKITVSYI